MWLVPRGQLVLKEPLQALATSGLHDKLVKSLIKCVKAFTGHRSIRILTSWIVPHLKASFVLNTHLYSEVVVIHFGTSSKRNLQTWIRPVQCSGGTLDHSSSQNCFSSARSRSDITSIQLWRVATAYYGQYVQLWAEDSSPTLFSYIQTNNCSILSLLRSIFRGVSPISCCFLWISHWHCS